MTDDLIFDETFRALTGNTPFPWQRDLYRRLAVGDMPESCDIPTGLGKTAIIPIWLIALANRGRDVPRRLVYVVNRRTVVDQATTEAERIRNKLVQPGKDDAVPEIEATRHRLGEALTAMAADPVSGPLAISTLRGQFADNREWSADPSRPAIIVGTVDMIGSRLLFSGYGAGFKTKPLYAGFLGHDSLIVHDEAHLEPAFQRLIEAIRDEQKTEPAPLGEARRLKVLALTATPRGGQALRLDPEKDYQDPVVRKRIRARKHIDLHPYNEANKLPELLASRALSHRESGRPVLVFARTVEAVEKVAARLGKECPERVEVLTGTLRGKERDELVKTRVFSRFLPGAEAEGETVYLVCTSAGEVGVNISADHLVCDLSTFESMAQRFGRVNRFGQRDDTRIDIFHPTEFDAGSPYESRLELTLKLLQDLGDDGSPDALSRLDPKRRLAAFSPDPTILDTSDILFDAWALTTIRGKLPGRPPVAPYLHGLLEREAPETHVAWRKEVGILLDEFPGPYKPEDLLADYPLKPHELLRDRSDRVIKHLAALAETAPDAPAWVIDDDGSVQFVSLKDFADKDGKDRIHGRTVLLPPKVGGLNRGMLDGTSTLADDVADEWLAEDGRPRRKRVWNEEPGSREFRLIRKIDTRPVLDEDGEDGTDESDETAEDANEPDPRDLWREIEDIKKRLWFWYSVPRSAEDVGSRSSRVQVSYDIHIKGVTENARGIVRNLAIPEDIKELVILSAELHDLGKKRSVWQRSIGNRNAGIWLAKSGANKELIELTDYRHEFGSLLDAELMLSELKNDDTRDLVLHLIAAHHGRGRPHFPPDEAFDDNRPIGDSARVAAEVPRRFARLQRKYGRWGLAYLESLLRAADYAASANPSETMGEDS